MLADIIVYFHLLFVALGLGLAVRLDIIFFRGRHVRPSQVLLADTVLSHQMISTALVGLWGTGIALIYLRTGFVLADFSPKLWAKVIIVTTLTINALVIGMYVMPIMERYNDRPVLDIPLRYKLPMAISAATSVFCWFTALALGAMATLKTQSWDVLLIILSVEYVLGLVIAIGVALWARSTPRKREPQTAAPVKLGAKPNITS